MRSKNQEIALKILKITGKRVLLVAVSMLAPQFPYLVLRAYLRKAFREDYKTEQLRNSVKYLKRKKFIAYKNRQFILTRLGKRFLRRQGLKELKIEKVIWDKKWRVLTFDIPEHKISARHRFRKKLKDLGFFHFQRSVFIIPYPCEKEIDQLAGELEISEYVHLLTAERFRNDKQLVKKFGIE